MDLLRTLCAASGPSGYEGSAAAVCRRVLRPLADEVRTDAMGSVVALRRATAARRATRRVLLAAHLDEIGLLVTRIEPGGFLRLTKLGGCDPRVLLGQEVWIHPFTKRGVATAARLPGVIGAKPPHFQSPGEQQSVSGLADLYIDLGMNERAVRGQVSVGDSATFKAALTELKNDRACGKALDNRACVAVMARALQLLRDVPLRCDVYAVATAQEEVGLSCLGALTATYRIEPDLAVALDVSHGDMPQAPESQTYPLGRGPVIAVGPNIHPAIADRLQAVARREEIPFQIEPTAGMTGTDAMDIQIARGGVPTALLGLPLRYMHTPVETLAAADLERAARLLARFLSGAHDLALDWDDGGAP